MLILLLAFSFFTPRFIEYADSRFVRVIPGLINLFIAPSLVVIIIKLNKGVFKAYFILYGFLVYIGAMIVSATIHYEAQSNELAANGVWGKAVVTDEKFTISRIQNKINWRIKCTFTANNHRFETFYESDPKNTYKVGDTLEILYSKDFPKMYRLKMVY
ncbi:hypothetical protein GCM10022392_05530 [Mucilaginibacter panaciglaebae]|uniref:DUF3592 domain-containing protein n=2 Tax=Mucilaginibacter panaciglaebae TaxID=502331 RepID=A0ABP7WEJ1_9SPHI